MLSTAVRGLARNPRNMAYTASRAFAAAAESTELKRFEPKAWFAEFDDTALRAELNKIREVENELLQTVNTQITPIDWSYWGDQIQYPGLVDEIKDIYDSTPVPNMDAEQAKVQEQVATVFDPIIEEFTKLANEAEAETLELEKRSEEVTYLRDNLKELTVEEFLERYPSVKKSIEDDVANNKWFVREG